MGAGRENRIHLERHVRHALEDFERLSESIKDNYWRPDDVEECLHSISHHLRHAAYRSGLEVSDG
jgi:glutamate formiminotransferase